MTLRDTKGVLASIMRQVPIRQSPLIMPLRKWRTAGIIIKGTRMWWKIISGFSLRNFCISVTETLTLGLRSVLWTMYMEPRSYKKYAIARIMKLSVM